MRFRVTDYYKHVPNLIRCRRPGRAASILAACAAALSVLCTADPRASQEPSLPPSRDPAPHRGFAFSPGTCELGPRFCAITEPREWAAAEAELMRSSLDEIAATSLGRRIIERALSSGFGRFRRFARAARLDPERGYQLEPATVATTHYDERDSVRTIDMTDRFFERRSMRDQFSGPPGYLLTTEILAHELVHAVDVGQRY